MTLFDVITLTTVETLRTVPGAETSATHRPGAPVVWRLPVLAAAGVMLLTGLYTGLLRLGVAVPAPAAPVEAVHGR